MPQTATHAFFAEDIYNKLDNDTKKRIKNYKKSLLMFSQSTDSLMFYNLTSLKPGKKIRKFHDTFHTTKTNLFFENLITYIKKNKYYEDARILTFLYGFTAHFVLDSTIHPYIFYKTGRFDKKNKETYKYNGEHTYMETYLDNYLIKERQMYKYQNFKLNEFCFDLNKFNSKLNDTISHSFKKTFNIKDMDKIYYKSLKDMELFTKLFRKDKIKLKKIIYKSIDFFTPKWAFIFDSISYNQPLKNKRNYLNSTHKKWCYPIDKNIESNKSFRDLYNDSLKEAINIINAINNYFYQDEEINIDELFHNKSYATGVDCSIKKELKYFEF